MRLCLLLMFCFFQANAYTITGKIIHIADGDTVTIMTGDYAKHKIRLYGIDAPEKDQAYGKKSKQMLSNWIKGRQVQAECLEQNDKYGRNICTIFLDNHDINASLVAYGGAWVYRQYYHGEKYYYYENVAKAEKRGLWATTEAQVIPPWQWRHGVNNDTNAPTVKLSRNKICHEKGTKYYNRVKRYTEFSTIEQCLIYGRLPRG